VLPHVERCLVTKLTENRGLGYTIH